MAAIAAPQMQRSLRDDVALLADADDIYIAPDQGVEGQPALAIRSDRRGAIQAINFAEVAQWARQHGCLALIKHSVGDFVQVGDPLLEVYGDPGDAAEAERTLNGLVALGIERTVEQDPAFAMRIMVDVANKALSAAINDPTTAVQVLNYIEDSLGVIGTTDLAERSWRRAPPPAWSSPTGVGRTSSVWAARDPRVRQELVQVMRRMRAMLERLADDVLPERRALGAPRDQGLDATVAQGFNGLDRPGPGQSLTDMESAAQGDWSQPGEAGRRRRPYRGPIPMIEHFQQASGRPRPDAGRVNSVHWPQRGSPSQGSDE